MIKKVGLGTDIMDLSKIFSVSKKDLYSIKGLILVISACFATYQVIVMTIKPLLIESFGLSKYIVLIARIHVAGFIVIACLIVGIWLFIRKYPKFGDREMVVLFAPHGNEEVDRVIIELQKRLKNVIAEQSLVTRIKVLALPPNIRIDNLEKAHQVREKTNCYLIIWGYLSQTYKKKKKIYEFPQVYFTYKYPQLQMHPAISFQKRIAEGILGRQWTIRYDDDHIDLKIVIKNFKETALYVTGLVLFIYNSFDEAIIIFQILREEIEKKKTTKEEILRRALFSNRVEMFLRESWLFSAQSQYNKDIAKKDGFNVDTEILKFCVTKSLKALEFKRNWLQAHLSIAVFYFLLNDIANSKKHITEAKGLDYKNSSAWISSAFINLWENKYEDALKDYEIILQKENTGDVLVGAIIFISQLFDLHRDRTEFIYALGFFNHLIGNEESAKDEFLTFMEKSKDNPELSKLRDSAQQYLK